MRVISKFHDYYDALMDNADSYIYKRVTYKLDLPDYNSSTIISGPFGKLVPNGEHHLTIEQQKYILTFIYDTPTINRSTDSKIILGVAGTLYHIVVNDYKGNVKLFDNSELYENDCAQNIKEQPIPNNYKWLFRNTCKTITEWDTKYKHNSNNLDIFINLKAPIFIIIGGRDKELIINPCIKDFNLHKYFNIHTIYQDIDHFCSNVLTNVENKDTIMTDIVKRDMKGFDKYSFKKDKIIKQS